MCICACCCERRNCQRYHVRADSEMPCAAVCKDAVLLVLCRLFGIAQRILGLAQRRSGALEGLTRLGPRLALQAGMLACLANGSVGYRCKLDGAR